MALHRRGPVNRAVGHRESAKPAAWGFAAAVALVVALLVVPTLLASESEPQKKAGKPAVLSKAFKGRLPITELSEDEAILHALNRLAFGPRPGDVERIRQMGLEKWIEQQLHPESLTSPELEARLKRFPTLTMSARELTEKYPNPVLEAARLGLTPEQYRERRQQERQAQLRELRQSGQLAALMTPEGRQRLGQPGERQAMLAELLEDDSPRRILVEMSAAKLLRAIYSEQQLQEVMTDFWFNHFNVFAQKGPVLYMIPEYERDVIRPRVFGKFRELLEATAKSPAMLFYLDNWQSADPKAAQKLQRELAERRERLLAMFGGNEERMMEYLQQRQGRLGQRRLPAGKAPDLRAIQNNMPRGLNENYARELMELHTLGVDGGYTQQDVMEVAKCFTGWTLANLRRDPEFRFDERIHTKEPKTVLGQKIDAGDAGDGAAVLALLSNHPNTARFISTKLARRFVSDTPPPALVSRMARTFQESRGDIRAVLRTMIYSPEFWSRSAYRAKIKKPFELVVSAARALGADASVPFLMVQWSSRIGEPLYLCQPPTGYSDKAEVWVNTGALLNRLNYAIELSSNRMRGVRVDLSRLFSGEPENEPTKTLERALQLFLNGQVSPQTRATLEKQLSDPQILRATLDDPVRAVDAGLIAGLVLGSPEFQRR